MQFFKNLSIKYFTSFQNGLAVRQFFSKELFSMATVRTQEIIHGKPSNICDGLEIMPKWATQYLADCIEKWKKVFPKENTWIQVNHGVPSLIIRIDCTIICENYLGVYEIEERPAGIGMNYMINESFRSCFDALRNNWPSFCVVSSDSRKLDDSLWSTEKRLEEIDGELVFPRVSPNESEYHLLEEKCVSVFLQEGNKSYGVHLDFWNEVQFSRSDNLPWDVSFALKPLNGTRCSGLILYSPLSGSKRPAGTVSRSRAEREFKAQGRMYLQEELLPMKASHVPCHDMIYCFYFGYDIALKKYVPLGGAWNSRLDNKGNRNYKIHGASDAVFGPLVCE